MIVSARKANVSTLLSGARSYRDFRARRSRPLEAADQAAINNISTAIQSSTDDFVNIDQSDLTAVHRLSDFMRKARATRFRVAIQVHFITSYLAVAALWLFPAPALVITAPLAIPYLCITAAFFSVHPIHLLFAMHLGIRYGILLVPSYYIARDLRYREFTKWPYLATAVIVIGWPLYFLIADLTAV